MTSAEVDTTASSSELGIDAANAEAVDLNVHVVEQADDERIFDCTISSPLVPELRDPEPEKWRLPAKAEAVVKECLSELEDRNSDGPNRMLALKGAGGELWEKAPEGLSRALDLIAEAGQQIRSIQIISEEGNIPWELMIPDDGDERPLGVRYPVSRWFTGRDPLRAAGKPAADARVAAPRSNLAKAQAEAKLVRSKLKGKPLKTTSAVVVEEGLKGWTGTVLHFVGHGAPKTLQLDGTALLTALQVSGMRSTLRPDWRNTAPVVFLNACKAGQAAPTLLGAGGITRSWTRVGAGAVIAPLWGVRDDVAHEVAKYFYERISTEPTARYAEIVRAIRAKAWSKQEDSYAAYCYYGSHSASAR